MSDNSQSRATSDAAYYAQQEITRQQLRMIAEQQKADKDARDERERADRIARERP